VAASTVFTAALSKRRGESAGPAGASWRAVPGGRRSACAALGACGPKGTKGSENTLGSPMFATVSYHLVTY